ncbi:hypothetical protein A2866_05250 [Candidatus Roizmanbacteria bacterium RIFCSPHIGHO2_01_FULL_39_8]|uniref:OmpR/PhoB-type domain-containing protein n=3 Tax=Candidatus Roizmaniibacteriota TaxID=1752723 RepID=A0A1F7GJU9_9BACT|nr:MAG: hypothetical protein A2866_05250 [Candidatus Roizmanbacteria bacterium RIFCSPHIGHO2_01_FULL_39_8]OGK28615.1 MAG: hypothetical protein A3C28_03110 [Candidatus Roizmanbacteria bacterium RIFCSPHIGHO2_02_FULL_39_9]OGK36059.1 MAG: hypothetical protein A3F60_04055 [Candidatus Roizmanbacteria bacterium RIFCSPHIGHO2_12_FULL_39_8]
MSGKSFFARQNVEYCDTIYRILKSGESGTLLFPPNTHKSNYFIDQVIAHNPTDVHLIKFDLSTYEMDDANDLLLILRKEMKSSKKKKFGVLINNARNLILKEKYLILNSLFDFLDQYPQFNLIFFFNIDITHPDIAKHLRSRIFGNVYYFPLYDLEDVCGFIEFFSQEWKMSFNQHEVDKIAYLCGGYFWLIKQVIRIIRDNPSIKFENLAQGLQVRVTLEQLYTSLLDSEKTVLQSLIQGKKIESDLEKHSLEYFKKIGLINRGKITIPLLDEFLREEIPHADVELRDNHIYVNSVNVDNHFSQKERRIFKALIDHKNEIVSRDELAKAIWPVNTDDFYSDWAVDRIVSRLREKIKLLGFSKEVIKTERNKGYIFKN